MTIWSKRWISYIISFTFVTVICVYLLDLPTIISQAPDLVNEYYYKKAVQSFLYDLILVATYIAISMYIAKVFNIESYAYQTVVVALVTMFISSSFMVYFQHCGCDPRIFFIRWFKRVGFKAVLYDMGLVSSIYITMIAIHQKLFKK